MKKILFVCLGNICRSPAAEGVFLDLIKKYNINNHFSVDSAGTIGNHIGEMPDPRTQASALKRGIKLISPARKIEAKDLENFDFILCMDHSNFENVKKLDPSKKHHHKIKNITDYRINLKFNEVPDPYYGDEKDFELVLDIVTDACVGFLKKEFGSLL